MNPYFPPNYDGYFPNQFPGGSPSADFSTRDQLFSGTVIIHNLRIITKLKYNLDRYRDICHIQFLILYNTYKCRKKVPFVSIMMNFNWESFFYFYISLPKNRGKWTRRRWISWWCRWWLDRPPAISFQRSAWRSHFYTNRYCLKTNLEKQIKAKINLHPLFP